MAGMDDLYATLGAGERDPTRRPSVTADGHVQGGGQVRMTTEVLSDAREERTFLLEMVTPPRLLACESGTVRALGFPAWPLRCPGTDQPCRRPEGTR